MSVIVRTPAGQLRLYCKGAVSTGGGPGPADAAASPGCRPCQSCPVPGSLPEVGRLLPVRGQVVMMAQARMAETVHGKLAFSQLLVSETVARCVVGNPWGVSFGSSFTVWW